jgi:hypothetical protein
MVGRTDPGNARARNNDTEMLGAVSGGRTDLLLNVHSRSLLFLLFYFSIRFAVV